MSSSDSEPEIRPRKSRTKRGLSQLNSLIPSEEITSTDVLYSGKGRQPLSYYQPMTEMFMAESSDPLKHFKSQKNSSKDLISAKKSASLNLSRSKRPHQEEILINSIEDDAVFEVKEPTPPPTPSSKKPVKQRSRRLKKGVKSAMEKLQKVQKFISVPSDDSDDCVVELSPAKPANIKDICVKIRCSSQVRKFNLKQTDSFNQVFKDISRTESVPEENLVVFFNDRTVHSYDSPKSLGLTIADILECHVQTTTSSDSTCPTASFDDPSVITLNLQMKDSRSRTSLSIRKEEPMEKLMQQFCKTTGVKYGTVRFQFDGESIDLTESAESLELETDYCIDVVPFTN